MRPLVLALVAAVAAVAATLALPGSASAYVYWANFFGPTIGRANNDGTGANQAFIAVPPTGYGAVAVAVDSSYIYWDTQGSSQIGRADLDGNSASINENFITGTSDPYQISTDGSSLYWASYNPDRTVATANLDGTGLNQNFVPSAQTVGVVVSGGYIYWSNQVTSAIERADVNGANRITNFITGVSNPQELAVDGSHIYWANAGTGTIGRANLDGSNADPGFITVGSANSTFGVAVDRSHIYWGNGDTNSIGVANLDGTGVNQSLISGAANPVGLAVTDPPAATTGAATEVTTSTSTLNATVNPEGRATTYHFEYGDTTSYGSQVPVADAAVGSDAADHPESQAISGLTALTTYHFRVVATSSAGVTYGPDQVFTTNPLAPGVSTPLAPAPDSGPTSSSSAASSDSAPAPDSSSPPPPPPGARTSGNLTVASGTVCVVVPGQSACVGVDDLRSIPVGSIVDATHGSVTLTVSDGRDGVYTGTFAGGKFRFTQVWEPTHLGPWRLATRLTLVGGDFSSCPGQTKPASSARRRVARYLAAKASGAFRVVGSSSSGIERGTQWKTSDLCEGTLTQVQEGAVVVSDVAARRRLVVTAGHSYLAKAAR